jgi:hypothetical protein
MFWEQTPASTITLQPASLPSSMQQFATNNSRWLQRVLWAFPKILAFVVVTGKSPLLCVVCMWVVM